MKKSPLLPPPDPFAETRTRENASGTDLELPEAYDRKAIEAAQAYDREAPLDWDNPEDEYVERAADAPSADYNFDPRTLGCKCDECPLGKWHRENFTWAPVPPEPRRREGKCGRLLSVSEFPATEEVVYRRPLFGKAGQVHMAALGAERVQRAETELTNMILCRPPGLDLKLFGVQVQQQWKKAVRQWERDGYHGPKPERPIDPIQACASQLQQAVERADNILALGTTAASQLMGGNRAITKVRGGFYTVVVDEHGGRHLDDEEHSIPGRRVQVLPTISPALPLHNPTYMQVYYRDIQRGVRWFTNRLEWVDANLLSSHPSVGLVEEFLARGGTYTFDLETSMDGPRDSTLYCAGVFHVESNEGIVIPWVWKDRGLYPGQVKTRAAARRDPGGHYVIGHYTREDADRIIAAIIRFLLDPKATKGVHNGLLFDLSILELELGLLFDTAYLKNPDPIYLYDGILLARNRDSELPRSLYMQGTLACDVPNWKGGGEDESDIRVAPRSWGQLATYNNTDNFVTSKTLGWLIPRVHQRKQWNVYEFDRKGARAAREMSHLGLRVNQKIRAELEAEYTAKHEGALKQIADLVGRRQRGAKGWEEQEEADEMAGGKKRSKKGKQGFNPASTQQLGRLLYEDWGLPIVRLTETGQPSTDDDSLRDLLEFSDPEQQEVINAVRFERATGKLLNSVILPLRLWSDLRPNSSGELVGGIVTPDGRVHPQYPTYVAATGRWASRAPNSQNILKDLRKMIEPEPGHVFLMADFDQIELRLFAALAKLANYLKVFAADGDPHAITAALIYGDAFVEQLLAGMTNEQREKYLRTGVPTKVAGTARYDLLRTFAKTFVYCVIYGGTADTVFLSVSSATDPDTGKLLFPGMTRKDVEKAYKAFVTNAPEIPAYWHSVEQFCMENKYVAEPIFGRRRDFLEFDRNAALNHGIQSAAAIIAGLGLMNLRKVFIPNFGERLGIVNQMHDAFTIEVREQDAIWGAKAMEDAINQEFPEQVPNMKFSAETDICVNFRGKKSDFMPMYVKQTSAGDLIVLDYLKRKLKEYRPPQGLGGLPGFVEGPPAFNLITPTGTVPGWKRGLYVPD